MVWGVSGEEVDVVEVEAVAVVVLARGREKCPGPMPLRVSDDGGES